MKNQITDPSNRTTTGSVHFNSAPRREDSVFADEEIVLLESYYPSGNETAQGVYAVSTSGIISAVDVVSLCRPNFESKPGLLTFHRLKTGALVTVPVPLRLEAWYKQRLERGGIFAGYYAFPELLFGPHRCQIDGINTKLPEDELARLLEKAVCRASLHFRDFVVGAGVSRPGLNLASLKRYNYAQLDTAPAGAVSLGFSGLGKGVSARTINAGTIVQRHYLGLARRKPITAQPIPSKPVAKAPSRARLADAIGSLRDETLRYQAATAGRQRVLGGCRLLFAFPKSLLQMPVSKITEEQFARGAREAIVDDAITPATKARYLKMLRVVLRTLVQRHDLDPSCIETLASLNNRKH